jgi:chromate transporter
VAGFVAGVTTAATGAIAGAEYVLGRRAVIDVPTALLAFTTFVVLSRWKVSELWLIGAAAIAGWLLGPR